MKSIRNLAVVLALLAFIFTAATGHASTTESAMEHYKNAILSGSLGNFKNADNSLTKALKDQPLFPQAKQLRIIIKDISAKKITSQTGKHLFKAIILSKPDSLDKSLKQYDLAIKGAPNYAKAYALRAMTRSLQNDLDGATSDLARAIKLSPDNYMIYYMRGTLYASKNIYTHALSDLNKAIELNPKMVEAYSNRAGLQYSKGEFDLAIVDLSSAIGLAPKVASLYQMRGFLYATRFNDSTKACIDLEKACKLGSCESLKMAKDKGICK